MYNSDNNNGLYNLTNINKRKQGFNTTFINSYPLDGNYNQKEVKLSFVSYRCLNTVKLNWSWQLNLLNLKPICIIKIISLVAAIFLHPTFVPCPCHTIKITFQLGLKINKIKNGILKERIKTV